MTDREVLLNPLSRELILKICTEEIKQGTYTFVKEDNIDTLDFKYVAEIFEQLFSRLGGYIIELNYAELNLLEKKYWTFDNAEITYPAYIEFIAGELRDSSYIKISTINVVENDLCVDIIEPVIKSRLERYNERIKQVVDIKENSVRIGNTNINTSLITNSIQPVIINQFYKTNKPLTEQELVSLLEDNSKLKNIVLALDKPKDELQKLWDKADDINKDLSNKDLVELARNCVVLGHNGISTLEFLVMYENIYLRLTVNTIEKMIGLGLVKIGNPDVPGRQIVIEYDQYNLESPIELKITDDLKSSCLK